MENITKVIGCAFWLNIVSIIPANAQDVLESRKGISYKVVAKEFVNEPNALRCGYNDVGFPITARTTIEVREYEEYLKENLYGVGLKS